MLSSGMSLGKQGPFVHIAGCIAYMMRSWYTDLQFNCALRHQFLLASVAVGVVCTFGTPIGGIIMAIEVSSVQFTV